MPIDPRSIRRLVPLSLRGALKGHAVPVAPRRQHEDRPDRCPGNPRGIVAVFVPERPDGPGAQPDRGDGLRVLQDVADPRFPLV